MIQPMSPKEARSAMSKLYISWVFAKDGSLEKAALKNDIIFLKDTSEAAHRELCLLRGAPYEKKQWRKPALEVIPLAGAEHGHSFQHDHQHGHKSG